MPFLGGHFVCCFKLILLLCYPDGWSLLKRTLRFSSIGTTCEAMGS